MNFAWDDTLILLCFLSAFVSILVTCQYVKLMRIFRWRKPEPNPESSRTRVSVIVPARNEEADLADALTSILNQQDVQLEVIVVNDHSSDKTGEIADSFARADSRVAVLHDPELQIGWLGKVNAMQHALSRASSNLLLFTDADVIHAPRCFSSGLAVMEHERLDLISLFPHIRCDSLIENVNVPLYIGGFCQICGEVRRARSDRAFGAGAFILVRAEVLRAAGGLESIKTEMLDDVELASLVKRKGYRVGFWAGSNLLGVRLFKGNWHAFWGPTKNVLAEMPRRVWMTPIAVLIPILIFWAPWASVVTGALAGNKALAGIGLATYVLQYVMLLPSREILVFHRGKLLFFPLVSIVLVCSVVLASYHYLVHGAVLWRGRSIRVRATA